MAIGVLDYLEKFEAHGLIENFRIVGRKLDKKHSGGPNSNEFVYKLTEAAGYYAARSDKIARTFAKTNADILSAQSDEAHDNPVQRLGQPQAVTYAHLVSNTRQVRLEYRR